MFHFPTLPPPALCVQAGATGHYTCQVSPFGHPRIKVWLPTPRGLSQAPTSFFGSWCQGIRRVPLLTWQLQMLASTMQFSRYGRSRQPSRRVPRISTPAPEMNSVLAPSGAVRREAGPDRGERLDARSLRTQQRARPVYRPTWRSIPQAGVLTKPTRYTGRITSAPPNEHHSGYTGDGSGQADRTHAGYLPVAP